MTELKTLKEIESFPTFDESYKSGFKRAKELCKQEAIKWIKKALEENKISLKRLNNPPFHFNKNNSNMKVEEFDDTLLFTQFFNIEEDELK